ncbi:unnamed protein product [Ilex paraguariensis]|uniref:Uncharacterized protein n=1 Tax=Ilex paraguariensis TaxID=185542 RepID=A0ABC8TT96_9AQUA
MLLKGQAKGGGLNNHPKGQKTKKPEATANLKMESFKTTCKGKGIISISLLNQLFVKEALCMMILNIWSLEMLRNQGWERFMRPVADDIECIMYDDFEHLVIRDVEKSRMEFTTFVRGREFIVNPRAIFDMIKPMPKIVDAMYPHNPPIDYDSIGGKGVVIDPSQKVVETLAQYDKAKLHSSTRHVAGRGDVFGDEDAIRQVEDDAHNEEQTTWEQAPTGSGSDRDVLLGLQVQMNEFGARMDRLKDNQLEILRLLRQGRGAGPSSSTE